MADDYSFNNFYTSDFVVPGVVPSNFSIEFRTNNIPQHSTYKIIDDNGLVVGSSNFTDPNTTYEDYYILNGCYTLIVEDLGGDGLSWWANTSQGTGYVRLKDNNASVFKTFQPDFGSRFEYSFTTDGPLSIDKNTLGGSLNLYPNPSHNKFILEGSELDGAETHITNLLGQSILITIIKTKDAMEFNTTNLTPGVYFITIIKNGNRATKKVNVY